MTREEMLELIQRGTFTGKLATVKEDGSPHVVPIWFVVDGEQLLFTTAENTVKAKNMRRDPRVTMCVDDQAPPYSFVTISGTVELSDDLEEMLKWATKIGERYMGTDRAEEFGKRNAVEGELLVRLIPTKIVSEKNVSD
jgi:PPOX class probable F420-dependent enzyme